MARFRPFFIKENQSQTVSKNLLDLLSSSKFSISVAEHKSSMNLLSYFAQLKDTIMRGGMMCHSDASLVQMLGISPALVVDSSSIEERVIAMAQRIKKMLNSDIGYACTNRKDEAFIYVGVGLVTKQYQRCKIFKYSKAMQEDQQNDLYLAPLYFFLSNQSKEDV